MTVRYGKWDLQWQLNLTVMQNVLPMSRTIINSKKKVVPITNTWFAGWHVVSKWFWSIIKDRVWYQTFIIKAERTTEYYAPGHVENAGHDYSTLYSYWGGADSGDSVT